MKYALLGAVASVAVAACAAAPAMAQDVEIRHAVARVIVIVEDRADIGVEVTQGGSRLPQIQVRRDGRDVRIDGGLRRRGGFFNGDSDGIRNCRSGPAGARQPGEGASVEVREVGRVRMEDAPLIVLRTPRDVDVNASGAVFGAVGRGARSIELGNGGCGDWNVANTDGDLSLSMGGSGSIRAGVSRSLEANVGGSGSVMAGATGAAEANVGGSGTITIARISGPSEFAIGGSGDIVIRDGNVPSLDISIGGSGSVDYGGATHDLDVSIAGSGDVRVRAATGQVSRAVIGSGDIVIGR